MIFLARHFPCQPGFSAFFPGEMPKNLIQLDALPCSPHRCPFLLFDPRQLLAWAPRLKNLAAAKIKEITTSNGPPILKNLPYWASHCFPAMGSFVGAGSRPKPTAET